MERTCEYIITKTDSKNREYFDATFVVPSTNIHVMDELRKKLREFNEWYNFGSHTGCLYDTKNHQVFFTVGIPVEGMFKDWEFSVINIFDNVESRIKEIEASRKY